MTVPYPGPFKRGQRNLAIEAVGRALCHTRYGIPIGVFALLPARVRQGWGPLKQTWLRRYKTRHGMTKDAIYTERAHNQLVHDRKFDARAKKLMLRWKQEHDHPPPPSPQVSRFRKMFAAMQAVHRQTPGYYYGGEHDGSISDDLPTGHFDCSSSSSYVLYKGGMFPFHQALVSGDLAARWGQPGKGKWFTLWANGGHAWIQLTAPRKYRGLYSRFDTSVYGDRRSTRSGARLRFLPRPTWGFTPRHWPGV